MINLSEQYRVNHDDLNWIVEKRIPNKPDEWVDSSGTRRRCWKGVAFFQELGGCYRYFVREKMKEAESLDEAVKILAKVEQKINELFKLKETEWARLEREQ